MPVTLHSELRAEGVDADPRAVGNEAHPESSLDHDDSSRAEPTDRPARGDEGGRCDDAQMDGDDGWVLGTQSLGKKPGAKFDFRDFRAVEPDEYAQFRRDNDLIHNVVQDNIVVELASYYQQIRDDAEALEVDPHSIRDRQNLIAVRRHVVAFLTEFAALRQRLEKLIDQHFGADSARDLRAVFAQAYEANPHFRLAWELRNDALHGGDPLEQARISQEMEGEAPDERKVTKWFFDLDRMRTAHKGDRRWDEALALFQGNGSVDVMHVLANAFTFCNVIYGQAVLIHEDLIRPAAHRVIRLHQEVADGKSVPLLYRLEAGEPSDGPRQMRVDIAAINVQQAANALAAVDSAAQAVASFEAIRASDTT